MFDLTLFPLQFFSGREQPDLPGLLAATPPRRTERRRAGEQLIALITGPGGMALPEQLPAEALQILAGSYYTNGGTVTSALRAALEDLNNALMDRNLKFAGDRQPALQLNLAVLRGNLVYLVHAGPSHSFVLTRSEAQDFSDPQGAGRGLGTSRAVNPRFFQAEVQPGDLLVFSPDPPASWTAASLAGSPQLSLDALRRRLLNQAPPDLSAGVVQLQEGSGQVRRAKLGSDSPSASAAAPNPSTPTPVKTFPPQVEPQPLQSQPVQPQPQPAQPPQSQPAAQQMPATAPALSMDEPLPSAAEVVPDDAVVSAARRRIQERQARMAAPQSKPARAGLFTRMFQRGAKAPVSAQTMPRPQPSRPWLKPLAAFFRGVSTARQRAGQGLARFFPRLLPGNAGAAYSLSPLTMFFIAIAVPVVVVAIATTVYLRSGAGEERLAYLQQAQGFADQAANQKDPALKRSDWTQVVYYIKKAEEFGSDDQSAALRHQAQVALDSMDGIVRLDLTPAFTGILSSQVNITSLTATAGDLYLLDSSQGRVMHMTLAGRSYEFDPNFSCGPGPSGGKIIGPLVGVAVLPPENEFKADVLSVDGSGNVLYCTKGGATQAATLAQPENNWGKITNMVLYNGNLFVMDRQNNAVWRFDGSNMAFVARPRLFFGNEIPDLSNVIDLTLYQDDLYLLRSTGKMTVCTYSGFDFSPTRCNDPASYGSSSGPVQNFADAGFVKMQTTDPPDPSLFILDTKGPAIYHFSLRLNYQRQLRQDPSSDFPLPQKPVTAFAIAPNRMIFMAFGNQIFFGPIP